ncbi:flagellar basal body L-ring protein FlgH [bacterium]|nr:flagellar basal body L-ring protein FlgH [bacterium]
MVRKLLTTIIAITAIMSFCTKVNAESLFTLSAAQQSSMYAPKSLFAGVRAMGIGDLVSIVIDERLTSTDTMAYNSDKSSQTRDNFTKLLENWLKFYKLDSPDNFGGRNTVENSANSSRSIVFGDTITAQVVQLLSNGNLLVQGKKTLVNNNERVDLIVTGVVDPRWINASGQISSTNVSNLQFALSGRGAVSRGQNEGIINRVIKYLF